MLNSITVFLTFVYNLINTLPIPVVALWGACLTVVLVVLLMVRFRKL